MKFAENFTTEEDTLIEQLKAVSDEDLRTYFKAMSLVQVRFQNSIPGDVAITVRPRKRIK